MIRAFRKMRDGFFMTIGAGAAGFLGWKVWEMIQKAKEESDDSHPSDTF